MFKAGDVVMEKYRGQGVVTSTSARSSSTFPGCTVEVDFGDRFGRCTFTSDGRALPPTTKLDNPVVLELLHHKEEEPF
jgi:hypothetical protein